MAKDKIAYVCSSCGYDSPKWIGKCPACGEWNTFSEYRVGKKAPAAVSSEFRLDVKSSPISMSKIETADEPRINMQDGELNRVLGGGLVPGSMTLLGGEPGIGKSTLILQTVMRLKDMKVLYVSGEESARQLKLRADRLNTNSQTSNLNLQLGGAKPPTSNHLRFRHQSPIPPLLRRIEGTQQSHQESRESG